MPFTAESTAMTELSDVERLSIEHQHQPIENCAMSATAGYSASAYVHRGQVALIAHLRARNILHALERIER